MVILIKPTIINNDRVWKEALHEVQSGVQVLDPRKLQASGEKIMERACT